MREGAIASHKFRARHRHIAFEHILAHARGIAIERLAPAAAGGGLDVQGNGLHRDHAVLRRFDATAVGVVDFHAHLPAARAAFGGDVDIAGAARAAFAARCASAL